MQQQVANRRSIAFFNGWMLILVSPILFIIGAGQAAEEYGALGILVGLLSGLPALVSGCLAVAWSQRWRPFR